MKKLYTNDMSKLRELLQFSTNNTNIVLINVQADKILLIIIF